MKPRLLTHLIAGCLLLIAAASAGAGEQPVAIFHAFNERYADVAKYVCSVGQQGYSHVQIAPAQNQTRPVTGGRATSRWISRS